MTKGQIRQWKVQSNSFGRSYEIEGHSLLAALLSNLGRIARDCDPRCGERPTISEAVAEWQPGLFRGRGGVELLMTVAPNREASTSKVVVWIDAPRTDLRDQLDLLALVTVA